MVLLVRALVSIPLLVFGLIAFAGVMRWKYYQARGEAVPDLPRWDRLVWVSFVVVTLLTVLIWVASQFPNEYFYM